MFGQRRDDRVGVRLGPTEDDNMNVPMSIAGKRSDDALAYAASQMSTLGTGLCGWHANPDVPPNTTRTGRD